jgi:uncharacterized protein (DUF2147 family)
MKRLLAMAIVLLASNAAQAQYQFEYGGRTIRIDPDRGTVSIPGVYDNSGKKSKRAKGDQDTPHGKPIPQDAKADPQRVDPQTTEPQTTDRQPVDSQTAPGVQAPAPAAGDTTISPPAALAAPQLQPPAANTSATTEQATTTANNAPASDAAASQQPALRQPAMPPEPAPLPALQQQDAARPVQKQPAPTIAAVPPPAQERPHDPNSPIGLWLTEEKEGKVRIEQCGNNLCGYSVDAKSNTNGEQVLINMRPGKDQKWSGRILDPNSGSTYDSTIAMKGQDRLRVQGCAFGGMFCGGQTWTRVN